MGQVNKSPTNLQRLRAKLLLASTLMKANLRQKKID